MDTIRQLACKNNGGVKSMSESAQALMSLACELFVTEISLKCREEID